MVPTLSVASRTYKLGKDNKSHCVLENNVLKRCSNWQCGKQKLNKYQIHPTNKAVITPWECLHMDVKAKICFKAIITIAMNSLLALW